MKIEVSEDMNGPVKTDAVVQKHKDKFGKEPNIIGMFWNDPEKVADGIVKAIEDNIPYDEYEMLSDEEKKAFDNGNLLF